MTSQHDQQASFDTFSWTPAEAPECDALAPFEERITQLNAISPMSPRSLANLRRALASIDPDERERFIAENRERLADVRTQGPAKYADFAYWADRSVAIAEWLDLDHAPPMDILDVGMGSGSFAMVAQSMGHRVLGTDVANPWYGQLCRLAGVERLVAPVERGQTYRPVDRRFDLITIMLPVFHRKPNAGRRPIYWTVEDWRSLLEGMQRDLLKSGGSIFILMPLEQNDDGTQSYSPLVEWAGRRGARLDRRSPGEPISRILFSGVTAETFGKSHG
ncbi:class I SAM-dependent methyltransferase [Sphingomonas sp.]|uniref:class I SAM-dependent methyltransferase n=1 Tax=Sphingomonas sp. TaxID=28214 RepID=UPI0025F41C80|nr:class I SAM-dependent methyltransferase [Sphingomonas sp.]MBV9529341.1 class I SAM-dependent methyltransferase [Sphingomonas sp.]